MWKDEMYAAIALHIREKYDIDAVKVVSIGSSSYKDGCDTCGWNSGYETEVWYEDSTGKRRYYEYEGDFSELIDAIT